MTFCSTRVLVSVITPKESAGPTCEVGQSSKYVPKTNEAGLRISAQKFQGLRSDRKALEMSEGLSKNYIDIVKGQ